MHLPTFAFQDHHRTQKGDPFGFLEWTEGATLPSSSLSRRCFGCSCHLQSFADVLGGRNVYVCGKISLCSPALTTGQGKSMKLDSLVFIFPGVCAKMEWREEAVVHGAVVLGEEIHVGEDEAVEGAGGVRLQEADVHETPAAEQGRVVLQQSIHLEPDSSCT